MAIDHSTRVTSSAFIISKSNLIIVDLFVQILGSNCDVNVTELRARTLLPWSPYKVIAQVTDESLLPGYGERSVITSQ